MYGDIFTELHNIDFRDNPRDAPDNIALGNAASSDRDVSEETSPQLQYCTASAVS